MKIPIIFTRYGTQYNAPSVTDSVSPYSSSTLPLRTFVKKSPIWPCDITEQSKIPYFYCIVTKPATRIEKTFLFVFNGVVSLTLKLKMCQEKDNLCYL